VKPEAARGLLRMKLPGAMALVCSWRFSAGDSTTTPRSCRRNREAVEPELKFDVGLRAATSYETRGRDEFPGRRPRARRRSREAGIRHAIAARRVPGGPPLESTFACGRPGHRRSQVRQDIQRRRKAFEMPAEIRVAARYCSIASRYAEVVTVIWNLPRLLRRRPSGSFCPTSRKLRSASFGDYGATR